MLLVIVYVYVLALSVAVHARRLDINRLRLKVGPLAVSEWPQNAGHQCGRNDLLTHRECSTAAFSFLFFFLVFVAADTEVLQDG